jgi:hypothetical protein
MTKKLTKQSEKIILAAVSEVVSEVQDGLKPTDAVVKVARDGDLSPNFIRLVCTGYNRGATNFQRESSDSVLDKMAEFPLADADRVIAEIWSTEDKEAATAVSDEYSAPVVPTGIFKAAARNKLLSTPLTKEAGLNQESGHDPDTSGHKMSFDHAYQKVSGLRRKALVKRSEYTMAQDQLLAQLGSLADSFKHDKKAARQARYAAGQVLGDSGARIMDFVLQRNKVAAETQPVPTRVNWDVSPYRDIKECLAAAQHVNEKKAEFHNFVDEAEKEAGDLMRPFTNGLSVEAQKEVSILDPMSKKAFSPTFGLMGLGQLREAISDEKHEPKRQARVQNLATDLEDPSHEQTLRKIQTQTMLADLLSEDEALSGYDPDDVLNSYNELAQMSPRTANQPAFVRAFLRKNMAQGSPETFEAKEVADVEKTLTDTQNPYKETTIDEVKFSSVLQEPNGESILTTR